MKRDMRYEYVCPQCFNSPEHCTCEHMPSYLMQIDRNIQEHIRVLQQKGYRTTSCCESHTPHGNMYINFAFDYGFGDTIPLPDGFEMRKRCVSYMYKRGTSDDEYKTQKARHLKALLDWCKSLPDAAR